MRILIVGPPRAGNRWLKCLLSRIYDLTILRGIPKDAIGLTAKINEGWFMENTIFHQHLEPTQEFFQAIEPVNPRLVTIIRNPYDMFVSLYHFVQNFRKQFGPEHHLYILRGKPIDHSDILSFLQDEELGYRVYLELANDWLKSDKTYTFRYEDLLENPMRELHLLAETFKPVAEVAIKNAVVDCSVQKMRNQSTKSARHIRKGVIGDYRNYLSDAHFEILNTMHGDLIRDLGYEISVK